MLLKAVVDRPFEDFSVWIDPICLQLLLGSDPSGIVDRNLNTYEFDVRLSMTSTDLTSCHPSQRHAVAT